MVTYWSWISAVWDDFDEDGRTDAALNLGSNERAVLLNRGHEVFEPGPIDTTLINDEQLQFATDLNGDGHLDLVFRGHSRILTRFGDGDGGFGEFLATPTIASLDDWRVADVDGDGRLDFVDLDAGLRILTGGADGAYTVALTLPPTGWIWWPTRVFAVGDFNGDGTTDIVGAAREPTTNQVVLDFFWNKGGLAFFEQRLPWTPESAPLNLGPVDLNGDGAVELVSSQSGTLTVTKAKGGSVGFEIREVEGLTIVDALGMADLDQDGHPDLVLSKGSLASVLWGGESGALGPLTSFQLPGARSVALADVNGDGVVDVVASSGTTGLAVVHGARGTRQLDAATHTSFGLEANAVTIAGDLNEDGSMDLVASRRDDGETRILFGDGQGGFWISPSYPSAGLAAVTADVDGDGRLDVALSARGPEQGFSVLFGDGAGSFTLVGFPISATIVGAAVIAGEARPALVSIRGSGVGLIRVSEGRTAEEVPIFQAGSDIRTATVGDIDRDGDSDLVIVWYSGYLETVVQTPRSWTGGPSILGQPGTTYDGAVLSDLDGDGWDDLVAWGVDFGVFRWTEGVGFLFTTRGSQLPGLVNSLAVKDVDGDTRPDLIVGARGNSEDPVWVLTYGNLGGTNFAPSASARASRYGSVLVFDADRDGWDDVVVSNWGAEVLRNTCQTARIRTTTDPLVLMAGEPAEVLFRVLPTRDDSIGLLTVYEGSTLLVLTQPHGFATAVWSSPGLAAGIHVLNITYDDQYTGTSQLELRLVVRSLKGGDTPGIYRASDRQWYLKNSNAPGAADLEFPYGDPSDQAVKGDWDGDGDDTVGIYRDGTFYLRNSNTAGPGEIVFPFGAPGDIPIAGDWDGDGVDTIGVYRPATAEWYLKNTNAAGAPDVSFTYGLANETPVTGDWDGDGIDTVGIFRASDRQWYLHNSNAGGNAELVFPYGDPAMDVPVVGDWDGNGTDTVGIYRSSLGEWFLKNTNEAGFADLNFTYGLVNEKPLAGDWDGD